MHIMHNSTNLHRSSCKTTVIAIQLLLWFFEWGACGVILRALHRLRMGRAAIFSALHGWGPQQAFQFVHPVGSQESLHEVSESPLRLSNPRDCIAPGPETESPGRQLEDQG